MPANWAIGGRGNFPRILVRIQNFPNRTNILKDAYWNPSMSPAMYVFYRAILYVVHGVTEHMGRYDKLGRLLAENGVMMCGHDLGESAQSSTIIVVLEYNLCLCLSPVQRFTRSLATPPLPLPLPLLFPRPYVNY